MKKKIFIFALITMIAAACAGRADARSAGKVLEWTQAEKAVILKCEGADVALSFLDGNILRFEVVGDKIQSGFPSLLTLEKGPAAIGLRMDRKGRRIVSGDVSVRVSEAPFAFEFMIGGKVLLKLLPDGIKWSDDGAYSVTFERSKNESFFGLGELPPDPVGLTMKLDQKNTVRTMWNRHIPPSDMGIPFYYSPVGYALYADNPWKSEMSLGKGEKIKYTAAGGPIRFYIIEAPDAFKAIERYTSLTGRSPIPPRWAAGYMQSRYGYSWEKDYRWLMKNFRERKIPCDALIFDLDWFGTMGNLKWHTGNFPNPEKLQKDLEADGFKTIVITEPYVFKDSVNFEEAKKMKLFAKTAKGEEYIFPFWRTKAGLLDFSNTDTQKWFSEKIKNIHSTGVDGWWTDLDEPEYDKEDMVYKIGSQPAAHNLQGFLMDKSIRDMYDKELPNERCFMMSRSGFSGIQRLGSSVWSGDVQASWAHLKGQIPIALNTSLSGIPLWNSDTGGFHGHPSPELYTRWIQFSAFTPVFRSHGNHDVREPWSFGEKAERICRKYIELRMRLVPYLYNLFRETNLTGAPIMRPTFMEAPGEDPELVGQYFYGHELLVAPVVEEGAKKKNVMLPAGRWTYFWDDRVVEGPKKISVPVDLDIMPIFVREGAIIPMAPVMQYTREKPVDPLTIHYYPGPSPSSYKLYEDDGESREYENGEFATISIDAEKTGNVVKIRVGKPDGKYKGMPAKRSYEIVIHQAKGEGRLSFEKIESAPDGKFISDNQTYVVRTPAVGTDFSITIDFND